MRYAYRALRAPVAAYLRPRRFPCPPKHVTMMARNAEEAMRAHTMLFAAAIGGLALAVAMSGTRDPLIEAAAAQVRGKPSAAAVTDVDGGLVIAVDVSYSLSPYQPSLPRPRSTLPPTHPLL